MVRKVLVTGGAGFIGSHVALRLVELGYEVVVFDNLKQGKQERLDCVEKLTGASIKFEKGDLTVKSDVEDVFAAHDFYCVIHLAGLKSVEESISEPVLYYQNNVIGTINLCDVMAQFGVCKLIFSSSATIYGTNAEPPVKEDFPTGNTSNPYGTTKYLIERFLSDLASNSSLWQVISLRYFNPVGAHFTGELGEDLSGKPTNLVPVIGNVALGKSEFIKVFGSDYETVDGTPVRDYIHVCDLAEGHVSAINYLQKVKGFEAFNLGTGNGYSVLQVLQTFEKVTGVDIPIELSDRRSGDAGNSYASVDKANTLLEWKATKGLELMLKDFWQWVCKNSQS